LTQQWNIMQAHYGQGREGVYDALGVVREKRDAIDKVLQDVVGGRRYVTKEGQIDRAALVNAVRESYPDISGLNIYDELITQIQACRQAFAADQTKLADQVRSYNDWRTTGSLWHPWLVERLGFPSAVLQARVGSTVYTGQEALDKMSVAIVGRDTQQIFDTGIDRPLSEGR
jgi:hypothetical protein